MSNTLKILLGLVLAGIIAIGAAGAYIYISGGSGEASEDVTENAEQLEADENSQTVFRISQDESTVSFTLHEELRGQPTTVVGTTNEVAGDILIDTATPANSSIGAIRINLRTLTTDNESRNRMMRSQILKSAEDQYEFTEFVPTSITGLPASVSVGDTFTFQVTGDLPLVGVSNEVTFDVTVTAISADRIEGTGTTTVLRSDYGLQIPNVPSVANVTDEVQLDIDFAALAVADGDVAAGQEG